MKTYEIVIILDSRRIEDNGDAFANGVTAEIEKLGGKVLDCVNMGRRAFARNIGKSKAGKIEADPVLAQIGSSLGRIPFKADPHTQMLLQMSQYARRK